MEQEQKTARLHPLPPRAPPCPHRRASPTATGYHKSSFLGGASGSTLVRMEKNKGTQRNPSWTQLWVKCITWWWTVFKSLVFPVSSPFLFLILCSDTRWRGNLLAGEFWEVPSSLQRSGHHQCCGQQTGPGQTYTWTPEQTAINNIIECLWILKQSLEWYHLFKIKVWTF